MFSYIILIILLLLLASIFISFRPAATQKIEENLYAIRCMFVNFYAVNTPAGIILFDTGVNPAMAKRGLNALGLPPDKVTYIFLTHTDYDHAGGISAFPNAKCIISQAEEQMINGKKARRFFKRNKLNRPYKTMANDETMVIGGTKVKLMLTPGHTPGSASYLINGRVIVSGDLLRISARGNFIPFLWVMNMNQQQDAQSVNAMQNTLYNADYVLTGHTGVKKVK